MAVALVLVALTLIYPNLPSLDILTDYRPKIPLRVYTADGYLIGEFGEERRSFLRIQDTPEILKQAILAAEDERFYQHGGIDAAVEKNRAPRPSLNKSPRIFFFPRKKPTRANCMRRCFHSRLKAT